MEEYIVLLILFLWIIPIIASSYVGFAKGRPVQGFWFGALFGVFGLIAIAAQEPAEHILEKRAKTLDLTGMQTSSVELETSRCEYCLVLIPRLAVICHACGHEVKVFDDAPIENSELMISVEIDGVTPANSDSGNLVVVIEPGFVTLSVCDDECEFAEHELSMNTQVAKRLIEEFSFVYLSHKDEKIYHLNGRAINLNWRDGSSDTPETPGSIIIDWTETFSQASKKTSSTDSQEMSGFAHGLLELTGLVRDEASQVSKFERALVLSTDVAALWWADEIMSEQVINLAARIGRIRT